MRNKILSITAMLLLFFGVNAMAQTMTSTAQLKLACETSPGNVVQINVPTQISTGPQAPATENVNSPCTIVLGPFASFEASQVSMTFAGALGFQAANEAHIRFMETEIYSPSISVVQTSKSLFQLERAFLRATSGDIVINSGTEGTVDVKGPILTGNMLASGAIGITGGFKFQGTLNDAGVTAGTGISVSMTGVEGQFTSTTSVLSTTSGGISVVSTGEKSFVEFKLGSVTTADSGLFVELSGNESTINAQDFTLDGGTGGATLRTGGTKGKVTMADGILTAGGEVTVQSSMSGFEGSAVVQNAVVNGGGDLRIETGRRGNSEVLDSGLTSSTLVRIATGMGGNCKSQDNIISAPVVQICPQATSRKVQTTPF